jgi:type 1 fimbriae regulatory protein FimB
MKSEMDAFFVSEQRGPLNRKTAWLAIRNYGERAGFPLTAHPHMLRHLGHRNIQHAVMYTAANPGRFERLWR